MCRRSRCQPGIFKGVHDRINFVPGFKSFGPISKFLIQPEICIEMDLTIFDWLEIGEFNMQMIDLKTSTLWVTKFCELRQSLESCERNQASR